MESCINVFKKTIVAHSDFVNSEFNTNSTLHVYTYKTKVALKAHNDNDGVCILARYKNTDLL